MKKLLLIPMLALAIGLGGCAETLNKFKSAYDVVTSASVSPKDVVIAASAYDVIAITATNYQRLVRCTGTNGPICRDPAMRVKIDAAIYTGRSARNSLKGFIRANPGQPVAITDYNTLTAATQALQDATATYRAAVQQ